MNSVLRLCGCLALCAGLAGPASASDRVSDPQRWGDAVTRSQAAAVGDAFGIRTIARASRDSTIGFAFPAEIAEVLVRGGQRVKEGELLVRARDEELRAQRDLQKISAETDLPVKRAHAAMEQARVEYEAHKHAADKNRMRGPTPDLDRARTTYILRKTEYEFSKVEQAQQVIQLEFRQAQLDRMRRLAPFDGIVDMVACEVGQVYRDSDPVLRIVNTDQLRMDVQAPAFQTIELALKRGDKAWVLMDLPGEPRIFRGQIIEVGAEVDSASHTRRVRVEIENPHDWPSGLNAWVRFTQPDAEWLARMEELPARENVDARSLLAEAIHREGAQDALQDKTRLTDPTPAAKPAGAPE
jgi:membrane fusion protein, multidrug efflux system